MQEVSVVIPNYNGLAYLDGVLSSLERQTLKNFEVILQTLFTEYKLKMTFEQHVLVGSTVRSYLAWLKDNDRLEVIFKDNMLLWKKN